MIKKIKMYIKIVLSFLMVFTLLSSSSNHVYAKNSQNKDNFPLKGVVKYNGKISYGGNIVGDFTVNGKQAFCMEHPVTTPPTGTELTIDIYENDNIRKVLYYGWGGYEQWSGFKSREHGIVVTSLMLSYYYYGDNSSPNTIKAFKEYIDSKKVSNFSVNFSKSNVVAYKDDNIQRTETIELISDEKFGLYNADMIYDKLLDIGGRIYYNEYKEIDFEHSEVRDLKVFGGVDIKEN